MLLRMIMAGAVIVGVCACSASPDHAAHDPQIDVSVGGCGQGWAAPHAGQQRFVLHNTDTRAAEVYLTDSRSGAVYADVEPVGPGTTVSLDIDLGSGSYAFRCAMEDEATVVGPTVRVPGHEAGAAIGTVPVRQADLITVTRKYQAYVREQLPALVRLTAVLVRDVGADRLQAARRDWLPAHLEYEVLGAAYGAFGDLDARINGLPDGLPGGVHDRSWSGFHRIEHGLWHGESAATLMPEARALRGAVDSLQRRFAHVEIDPLQISIRAHEIAENALQFELTGRTDYGSHSSLATVRANLAGTQVVLRIIAPLLAPRDRQLRQLRSALDRARRDLSSLRRDGVWPGLADLGVRTRERIDAEVSELCELLAPVASMLEPRRTS